MKTITALQPLNNEKGIAMVETIPLLFIFVVLVGFGLGFFGVVHTAVLHSIAARTYAYETFRNRANLNYFREDGTGLTRPISFAKKQWRYMGIQNAVDNQNQFVATQRPLSFGRTVAASDAGSDVHNSGIYQLQGRNEKVSVSPVWVMVGYGICLTAQCGN